MLDTAQELRTQVAATQSLVWDVIRSLGKNGEKFTLSEILRRVPHRGLNNDAARRYVFSLATAGHIVRCEGPRCAAANAQFRIGGSIAADAPDFNRPEPVAFVTDHLALQIPRSHDGIWMLMRWLCQHHGSFRLSELLRYIGDNIAADEVRAYVRALTRAGIITPDIAIGYDPPCRVDLRYVETPRLRADGTLLVGPQRLANLWRSMKMCSYFTAHDLAVAASLPELPISVESAGRYAADLAAAGYLIVRAHATEPTLYRLKPRMNTGPAAPEILRARFVWDPNLCRVVGDAIGVEEVRP